MYISEKYGEVILTRVGELATSLPGGFSSHRTDDGCQFFPVNKEEHRLEREVIMGHVLFVIGVATSPELLVGDLLLQYGDEGSDGSGDRFAVVALFGVKFAWASLVIDSVRRDIVVECIPDELATLSIKPPLSGADVVIDDKLAERVYDILN